jgi:hypothetical protein
MKLWKDLKGKLSRIYNGLRGRSAVWEQAGRPKEIAWSSRDFSGHDGTFLAIQDD